MITEHLLYVNTTDILPDQPWWEGFDTNTTGPQDQKDSQHGTCSKPHIDISDSSSREDYPVG